MARSDGGSAGTSANNTAGTGNIDPSDNALKVHVEDIDKMTIEVITLACAGDCADIEAVAKGGNPAYHFKWEDGSTKAKRHVCLDASAKLSVEVTDTAIESEELGYDAQTVSSEVTAAVLECAGDGGVVEDGGATGDSGVCEMLMWPNAGCPDTTGTGRADGFDHGLKANVPQRLRVVGTGSFVGGTPWSYEVWGSSDGCALDELLGSYELANGAFDIQVCLKPTQDHAKITLVYGFKPTDGVSFSPSTVSLCESCGE